MWTMQVQRSNLNPRASMVLAPQILFFVGALFGFLVARFESSNHLCVAAVFKWIPGRVERFQPRRFSTGLRSAKSPWLGPLFVFSPIPRNALTPYWTIVDLSFFGPWGQVDPIEALNSAFSRVCRSFAVGHNQSE